MGKEPQSLGQLLSQGVSTLTKAGDKLTIAEVENEFKHIKLTEQDRALGLLYTYETKLKKLILEKEAQDKQDRIDNARAMWSYEECYNYALSVGHNIGQQRKFDFVLDDDNKGVFNLLALYFSRNKKFEETQWFGESFSLDKGICLLSPVRGNGKTTLLDCFMYNKVGCFAKVNTKFMASQMEDFGPAQIKKYMWLLPCPSNAMNFFQEDVGFHYDDFGDEESVIHMGQRKMISSAIINSIYDFHRDDYQFHRFHISMNYKWSEYEQKFGSNTASRLAEMFNLIKVPGDNRRDLTKKKRLK